MSFLCIYSVCDVADILLTNCWQNNSSWYDLLTDFCKSNIHSGLKCPKIFVSHVQITHGRSSITKDLHNIYFRIEEQVGNRIKQLYKTTNTTIGKLVECDLKGILYTGLLVRKHTDQSWPSELECNIAQRLMPRNISNTAKY